jgi:RNA methyltransferase, TrmH family
MGKLLKFHERTLCQATSRHGRRKHGLVLCEGVRACREALARRPQNIRAVVFNIDSNVEHTNFVAADFPAAAQILRLASREFASVAQTDNPQGVLMVLDRPSSAGLDSITSQFVLILDRVQDPGNAGTILRTAWAAGLDTVIATTGTVDLYGPKTIRAGMGAQFALNIHTSQDLQAAKDELARVGVDRLWESVPTGGVSCYADDFDLTHSGLVVGNEANGSALLSGAQKVSIPMPGNSESLNAAQAATLLIFEGVRRGLLG